MSKPRILIQLDPDRHASVFDAVVAADCQVDHLLQYSGVRPEDVMGLVHGAMFTRGPNDLRSTAVFVGGASVQQGEALLDSIQQTFFGPLRVSVMLDANGANTTAAAAVVAAGRHLTLSGCQAAVLAGTGSVGQRVARLLARQGVRVRVTSRRLDRAQEACREIGRRIGDNALLEPCATDSPASLAAALSGVNVAISAGAAGAQLLPRAARDACPSLRVAIDLNAVPPAGIEGVGVTDAAKEDGGVHCYGAIGVGLTKMRIHKAALKQLFDRNDLVLDAEQIFELGRSLE
jgi:hypothetical protein